MKRKQNRTAGETAKEKIKGAREETAKGAREETLKGTAKDARQDTAKRTAKDAREDTARGMVKNAREDTAKGTIKGAAKDATEATTGKITKEAEKETKRELIGYYRKFTCCILLIGGILFGIQLLRAYIMEEDQALNVQHLLFDFINIAVLLTIILILGYRYVRHLCEIASGIDALAAGRAVHLKEEGISAELAASINKTSDMLEEQRRLIAKRDNTRMEWIRGVSHDIRTPLSMVMGYAEMLEDDEKLGKEQRQRAAIIKEQSLRMRELIEDLNLTSKLEQDCQPLRLSRLSPAELLRDAAAAIINAQSTQLPEDTAESEAGEACEKNTEGHSFPEKYDIILLILPAFEKVKFLADQNLLRRVFSNIIGNAVRHNPDGCSIMVLAHCNETQAIVEISDNGAGIPEDVARMINAFGSELAAGEETAQSTDGAWQASGNEMQMETARLDVPHVMGMRIAKQIMLAHGGNLLVLPDRHTVSLVFAKIEVSEQESIKENM